VKIVEENEKGDHQESMKLLCPGKRLENLIALLINLWDL
jgi:hypothetical protein